MRFNFFKVQVILISNEMANMSSAPQLFDQSLDENGLIRFQLPQDGKSLYRAVSQVCFGMQERHEDIEKAYVEAVRSKRGSARAWEHEMDVLAELYNVYFIVYEEDTQQVIRGDDARHGTEIKLCLTAGDHFDLILTKSKMDALKVAQSIVYNVLYKDVFKLGNDAVDVAVDVMLNPKNKGMNKKNITFDQWCELVTEGYEANVPELPEDHDKQVLLAIECGVAPFPFKVAKCLKVSMYRNVDLLNYTDNLKQAYRKENTYCPTMGPGVKCMVQCGVNFYQGYVQAIDEEKESAEVYMTAMSVIRSVPLKDIQICPIPIADKEMSQEGISKISESNNSPSSETEGIQPICANTTKTFEGKAQSNDNCKTQHVTQENPPSGDRKSPYGNAVETALSCRSNAQNSEPACSMGYQYPTYTTFNDTLTWLPMPYSVPPPAYDANQYMQSFPEYTSDSANMNSARGAIYTPWIDYNPVATYQTPGSLMPQMYPASAPVYSLASQFCPPTGLCTSSVQAYNTAQQMVPSATQVYPWSAQTQPMNPQGYSVYAETYPSATLAYPGATLAYPGATQTYPAATLAHPAATLAHPAATLAHPAATLAHPAATLAHPGATLAHPAATLAHPAATQAFSATPQTYPAGAELCSLGPQAYSATPQTYFVTSRVYPWATQTSSTAPQGCPIVAATYSVGPQPCAVAQSYFVRT